MYSTILQILEETEKKYPEKIAFADLFESFTFSQLVKGAKRIGSFISNRLSPNNPIVIYMDKKAYNMLAFMGVLYAGCFYVPIDSQMPLERIKLILETLNPSMILYDDVTEKNIANLGSSCLTFHYKLACDTVIDVDKIEHVRKQCKSTDLIYVLFTSGSTGIPKGVTISHGAVIDFVDWICNTYNLDSNISLCNQAPFYFDASVPDLYIPLKVGATTYIPPKNYYTFPKKILKYIEDNQINTLIWVPSALCNVVNCRAFEVCIPSSVRLVIFCGEVMPCKHLNVWRKYIPNALYVNMYGPTEATYACMYYNITRSFSDEEKLPLGRACGNSQIILLDEQGQKVEQGKIGEICILGQCLSYGYYNNLEKTTESFVQNPNNPFWDERMYRTGDLAYENEQGDMIFVGRKDFQIKKLGHRIELGEIENVILSIEGIESVCCVYLEKSELIIVDYVGNVNDKLLVSNVKERLPRYMWPDRYINIDKMPMNMNGKIDRLKLKEMYTEGEYEKIN